MTEPITRRRFLQQTFFFSSAALLAGCGGAQSASTTPTAPTSLQPATTVLHLLAFGDWGSETDLAAQTRVAAAMRTYVAAQNISPSAVLLLGDNFYGALPGGVSSPRWATQFEDMYPASTFNCPFFGMLGNHDYQIEPIDKVAAELAYAAPGTSRWRMPSRYYTLALPAADPILTILVLDSNHPNEPAQPPPPPYSAFYTPTSAQVADQQAWLQATLAQKPTTPFTFVAAHHPIYSNGAHGDNQTLIKTVDPLLQQYAPQLYLAGHDHDLQHLEFANHPTSFVLCGGGGAELAALRKTPTPAGPFAREVHGFTHIQVTPTLTTVRLLDETGTVLHAFQKALDGTVTLLT